jgi:hypothetical protein
MANGILNPDLDIPPNQFLSSNTTSSTVRVISTQQTYHDDVLKQPVLKFFLP